MQTDMKATLGAAILGVLLVQSVVADPTVQQAQEALKEQGFYYGEVTGQKNADTTAAIRRFQIRNGLQVTGELNDETLLALKSPSSSAAAGTATPTPQTNTSEGSANTSVAPVAPRNGPVYSPAPAVAAAGAFRNTPYETAPPEVQRRVIIGAQTLLRRRGYFKGAIDGAYGPEMEFSLRAYQSRAGIALTGHLDMDTLGSLGLLPGQQFLPRELPRRRVLPRPLTEPPVRGEWVPEDRDRDEGD
jgi:peptidoglycan hydrolase-like protein with peptidoglycan-binding domain